MSIRYRHVMCPHCSSVLVVPPGCSNAMARCAQCKERFRLPRRIAVTDDAVAAWLVEGHEPDLEHDPAPLPPVSGGTQVLPAVDGDIRLVKLDNSGALLEFPAGRLLETQFRCAMPRRCMHCGTQLHLQSHVIIFAAQLKDSFSLEDERSAGRMTLREEDVRHCTNEELLGKLPKVPNVPHPGNLPMPYWMCDMCSGVGMISGQISVNHDTGEGSCRLLIHNIRRADEFLSLVAKRGSPDRDEIKRWLASTAENPWDHVPTVVQHRVQQWFKPRSGEKYITYCPDRDHTRTEDGMVGILLSNSRIVYHSQMRHWEMPSTENVAVAVAETGGKTVLQLNAPNFEIRRMAVDREGLSNLRRGLTLGRFQVTWR